MKRLFLAILISIPLLFVAAQLALQLLPLDGLRSIVEQELSEILARSVRIEGDFEAKLIPWLRLETENVVVESRPGDPSPSSLTIRHLALELRLAPLLFGRFVVEALDIDVVSLRLDPAEGDWMPLAPNLDELDEGPEQEDGDSLRFAIRRLRIRQLEVFLDPEGSGSARSVFVDELLLAASGRDDPIRLELRGSFEGGRFDIVSTLGSPAELARPTRPFPVSVDASIAEGRLEARGTIAEPAALRGLDLRFEGKLADDGVRSRELGIELPPLGSIEVEGRLVDRDGPLGIDDLVVRSRGDGPIDIDVRGTIRDLVSVEGIDLVVTLAAADIDRFQGLTTLVLPGLPLRARFGLDDRDGSLGFEGQADLLRPDFIELSASGVFDDLPAGDELDIRLDLAAHTLDTLGDTLAGYPTLELPELGPVRAAGRLEIVEGMLGLDEIVVTVGDREAAWVEISGSIGNLLEMRQVELEAAFGARSTRRVATLFDREIPEVGGLSGTLSIFDQDGTLGIESASVEVGRPDAFYAALYGSFDDLLDLDEITVEAELRAPNLDVMAELMESELPSIGPIRFDGKMRGSNEALRATGRLQVGDTLFTGEFDGSAPLGERPVFDVRVHSPVLDLTDLLKPSERRPRLRGRDQDRRWDLAAWWRGESELPLEDLRGFDGQIRLTADRLVGYELLDSQDLFVAASLEAGVLSIDELSMQYESGRISGHFELDAHSERPELELELETFNVDLTRLTSQFMEETDFAGLLDLSFDLHSAGATPNVLLANLEGVAGAMLRRGALVGRYARAFTFDVVRVSMPSFVIREDATPTVHCLLALFPIEQGVATTEALYLEGEGVTIEGTGQVDLARDAYDLRLTPELDQPGLVSVAATVEVTGPLREPNFRPIRRSMVTSALGALWQNAFRPVRAIDRLIRRSDEDVEVGGVCDQIVALRVDQMTTQRVEAIDLDELRDPPAAR